MKPGRSSSSAPTASSRAQTSAAARLWTAVMVLVAVVYPLIVWFGLTRWSARSVGLLVLAFALPGVVTRLARSSPTERRAVLGAPIGVACLVILTSAFDDHRFLLALPVGINLILLGSFGASLRTSVPMVERYARMQVSDLSPAERRYCRSVTITWCVFFGINGTIAAVLAVAASTAWWALYTGGLSYILIGLLFGVEVLVRKIRFRRYGTSLLDRVLQVRFPSPRSPAVPARPATLTEHSHQVEQGEGLETHRYGLSVPSDLCFFEGHFPDFELLPGVVQLSVVVVSRCRRLRPGWTGPRRLTRLKFNRPIRPGDRLELLLQLDDSRRTARYHLDRGGEACASGRLEFESAAG